jgi:DUF4097 and DUF4098 domain-containing protein YvlB
VRTKVGILALLLLAFTLAANADDWNRAYQVQGRPQLLVEADDGNVTVSNGADGSVHLSVHSQGWRIAPDEIEVNARQDGNRVELTLRKHNQGLHVHFHTSLEIRVTLPAGSDLDVHTRDGNLDISGIKGTHKLRTGDGNAELRNVDGSVELETGDGNLGVDGRFDLLSLHTGDGNIDAVARSGSMMKSAWSLRTGDGNIHLRVPDNFAADLDAHTGDGHVRSDIPITANATGGNRENDLRGRMNGGGQTLSIRTGDGSIEIRR